MVEMIESTAKSGKTVDVHSILHIPEQYSKDKIATRLNNSYFALPVMTLDEMMDIILMVF